MNERSERHCNGTWTGQEENWLNVEGGTMYWSHTNRDTFVKWLKETGFQVIWDRFIPEGNSGHTLILAKKTNHIRQRNKNKNS